MFTTVLGDAFTVGGALLCVAVSLALGLLCAFCYMRGATYTKSFVVTLTLLPLLVQVVMMMVNGNLGTGVAVMGAFSLIRFRSVPGSSREILAIFLSMAVGIACGMGYLTFAATVAVIACAAMLLLGVSRFGETPPADKHLRVTIPENLDYTSIFDDLFAEYTKKSELVSVKTTNLGSMYELKYDITLKDLRKEKEFIDQLRCRNGNLTIVCGRASTVREEL